MKLISTLAQVATLMAVVTAIVFGLRNIRDIQRTRLLTAAAELVEALQTPEFTGAMHLIMRLPEGADPQMVRDDPDLTRAVYAASHVFEGVAVLVFYRLMPLHMVDHLLGGYARGSWRRLQPFILAQRVTDGAMFGEWFQWLAARMEESPASGKAVGAQIAHREWTP